MVDIIVDNAQYQFTTNSLLCRPSVISAQARICES